MTPVQAMRIYQLAIDPTASADEGVTWWGEVRAELEAVIAAPSSAEAASLIAWWHHDWRDVGDAPARAAGRIRRHAAGVLNS